jgi:hypothetical protein
MIVMHRTDKTHEAASHGIKFYAKKPTTTLPRLYMSTVTPCASLPALLLSSRIVHLPTTRSKFCFSRYNTGLRADGLLNPLTRHAIMEGDSGLLNFCLYVDYEAQ